MLSVVIITKNEATHIARCLESVAWADEIVVLDSGSEDATVEICRRYTDKVFETDWPGFGIQKQRAVTKTRGDWVLSIDADEYVSPQLRDEIQQAILQTDFTGYEIPRLSSYCGRQIRHGGWWPDYVLRLFRREHGQFTDDLVHEMVMVQGDTQVLKNPLIHDAYINVEEVLSKVNSYSSLGAEKLYNAGSRSSLRKALVNSLWMFIRTYFIKAAFLEGRQGLMMSISNAEGTYYKYIKLIELENNPDAKKMSLISLIVTTYNWPEALDACLKSLLDQLDQDFEIIIADDGSTEATKALVAGYKNSPIPLKHVYHEDRGFRAGTIRNKAVAASRGRQLVFIDGDCLVFPDFIATHRSLAAHQAFIPGNRILLTSEFTQRILKEKIPLQQKHLGYFIVLYLQKKINRLSGLLRIPIGPLRLIHPKRWQKAMTCNLSVMREDFLTVNGFDENFEGWGYEDSDLVIRLIHKGIHRKEGRFAVPVLHLWHPTRDTSKKEMNYQRLMDRLAMENFFYAKKGMTQYL